MSWLNKKLLYPGLYIKRWLLLLILGITTISLGFAYLLRQLYIQGTYPFVFYYLTLQFLPRWMRALVFASAGTVMVVVAIIQLNRTILAPYMRPGQENVVEAIYQHQQLGRGPRITALGGGTGLPVLLSGLKQHTSNLSAIVTVADDGGSSGRLRQELGILPPGDFRNCIAALSEAELLTTRLFQYRFNRGSGLNGHSFGNLFIASMAGVTGSFEQGLLEASRVLAVRGRVLPSTLDLVTLIADVVSPQGTAREQVIWKRIEGESKIPQPEHHILRVYLDPPVKRAYPEALRAILEADLIIAGPGSLYTSVIPNLLVEEIAQALQISPARKLYVCNIATQPGETEGYTVQDHVQAINDHLGHRVFTDVLYNTNWGLPLPKQSGVGWVKPGPDNGRYRLIGADCLDESNIEPRHNPAKLAKAVIAYLSSQDK